MSYSEIVGPDGKILPIYIDEGQTVPPLGLGEILSGQANGTYAILPNNGVADGTILMLDKANPLSSTGLRWANVPGAEVLAKGQLLTGTDSSSSFKLNPGPLNYVLTSNPTVEPGLAWRNVRNLITTQFPLANDNSAFGIGTEVISLAFTPDTNGEIPVGLSSTGGDLGGLLPKGSNGQVLTVNSMAPSGFGIEWQTPFSDVVAGTNITIPDPQVPIVSLSDPLTARLNIGSQNIIGTTGELKFTDSGNTNTATLTATSLNIADTAAAGLSSVMNETGFFANNGSSSSKLLSDGVSKLSGSSALTISNTVSGQPITLTTNGNTSNVNVSCPLKPTTIKDSTDAVGNNQYLTANGSGQLIWGAGVGGISAAANGNIIIGGSSSSPTIAVISPLNATLSLGSQAVTGGTASITLINGANTSVLDASTLSVSDSVTTTTKCAMSKTIISAANSTDVVTHDAGGIIKSVGTAGLAISHTVSGGPINLSTAGNTSNVNVTCPLKPAKIKDKNDAVGNVQYLTADSNGLLLWAAGVGAVTTAAGSNIAIGGTAVAPTISLSTPLNATLAMGTQGLRDTNSVLGTSGQVLTSTGTGVAWANAAASAGVKYALVQAACAPIACTNSNSNSNDSFQGSLSIVSQTTNDGITFSIVGSELVYTGMGSVQLIIQGAGLLNTIQVSGPTNIDFITDSQWFPYLYASLTTNLYTRIAGIGTTLTVGGSSVGNNSALDSAQYNFNVSGTAVLANGGRDTLGLNFITNYIFNGNFQSPGLVAFNVANIPLYITAIRLT